MARPGQFSVNPMMHPSVPVPVPVPVPVNLPIPESGTGQSSVGKRRREDELFSSALADESAAKRRAKLAPDVLFRIVVPSRQIGKEGFRIQNIREDTKATIKIADAIARREERVIIKVLKTVTAQLLMQRMHSCK